jgi:hypothetical protein
MNISPLLNYKVIEFDKGLAIVPADARTPMPGLSNLIIAPMPACCEYLAKYTEHRAAGKEVREAHELALRGAMIIQKGAVIQKGTLQ